MQWKCVNQMHVFIHQSHPMCPSFHCIPLTSLPSLLLTPSSSLYLSLLFTQPLSPLSSHLPIHFSHSPYLHIFTFSSPFPFSSPSLLLFTHSPNQGHFTEPFLVHPFLVIHTHHDNRTRKSQWIRKLFLCMSPSRHQVLPLFQLNIFPGDFSVPSPAPLVRCVRPLPYSYLFVHLFVKVLHVAWQVL